MICPLPAQWQQLLTEEINQPYFISMMQFLEQAYATKEIYPPKEDIFNAFVYTPYDQVKVVILGQDPYHGAGLAHGLSFSVLPHVPPPPSLKNIYKELQQDIGCPIASHGYLKSWAEQGVLLLNTTLTVEAHRANSHEKIGWQSFTDAILAKLNQRQQPIVFILWGNNARAKSKQITNPQHHIIQSAHPSPLSARHGFWGSRPFSTTNKLLRCHDMSPIHWQLPPL